MSIKNKITRLEEAGVNKILKLLGGKNATAAGLGIEGVSSILEMLQGVGMAKGGIANALTLKDRKGFYSGSSDGTDNEETNGASEADTGMGEDGPESESESQAQAQAPDSVQGTGSNVGTSTASGGDSESGRDDEDGYGGAYSSTDPGVSSVDTSMDPDYGYIAEDTDSLSYPIYDYADRFAQQRGISNAQVGVLNKFPSFIARDAFNAINPYNPSPAIFDEEENNNDLNIIQPINPITPINPISNIQNVSGTPEDFYARYSRIFNQGFSNGGGVDTAPGTTKPEGLSALLMQDSSRLSLRLFGKDLNQLNAEEKQYLERYLEKQIAETRKEEDDE